MWKKFAGGGVRIPHNREPCKHQKKMVRAFLDWMISPVVVIDDERMTRLDNFWYVLGKNVGMSKTDRDD